MKRIQTERTASQGADEGRKMRRTLIMLLVCAVLLVGTTASAAALGGSLSRFSHKESHVIPLVVQEEPLNAIVTDAAHEEREEPTSPSQSPEEKEKQPSPSQSPAAASETAAPRRAAAFQGDLKVHDSVQNWSTKTLVNLFKESYNETGSVTVNAENGQKLIAPGTSNYYAFTVENNSNYAMDYTILLKLEGLGAGTKDAPTVPLEWRLLAGDGSAVSDWRGYNEIADIMEQATLGVRRQSSYIIEWRWDFERGGNTDMTDTELGNLAAEQLLGAEATILVYAEQNSEQGGGQGKPASWPKTGDPGELGVYIVLMTISGGGLLLLLQRGRRKKTE